MNEVRTGMNEVRTDKNEVRTCKNEIWMRWNEAKTTEKATELKGNAIPSSFHYTTTFTFFWLTRGAYFKPNIIDLKNDIILN